MEDTLQRNKRGPGAQKGNVGHSKHHAQTDVGKETGNGGHFLKSKRGKQDSAKVGRKRKGNGGHSPEKHKGTGEAKGEWRTL